jgi:dihydrodipicolinate synthase/N-acetylneuraminate lyase
MKFDQIPADVLALLRRGTVIPAHLLALDANRRLDPRRQRALSRYYLDAGAGGLAVGVHATQFAIREAGLYEPVLKLAAEEARAWARRPIVLVAGLSGRTAQARSEAAVALAHGYHAGMLSLVAGLSGKTAQARKEAEIARGLGYHAGMLSLAAMKGASEDELVAHCAAVAAQIPLVGFYLQPAVGGIALSAAFWRRFCEIENVIAVKVAPFNRYRTLDVAKGLVAARAEGRVTLYTGNDDHIVLDLLVPLAVQRGGQEVQVRIKGGLLGHWSVWTKSAVDLLEKIRNLKVIDSEILALDSKVTDANSAFFDVAHDFAGCIAGCHEVLRRQGLFEGSWCLDPKEGLSPGQAAEIDRVHAAYPEMNDDAFVRENLARWLA